MYKIYGRPNCGWCVKAKNLALVKGVSFEYIDIDENLAARRYILNVQGHRTVPQIYFEDGDLVQYVGGFEAFKAELDDTDSNGDVPENV
jgi:glutaredoxin 1